MSNAINVGMAEYAVSKSPDILSVVGLGSCIAVCIYDSLHKIGGLSHIMLPASNGSPRGGPKKYADTAIKLMVTDLLVAGAQRHRLIAKIAGGAQMFAFSGSTQVLNVGMRNIEAVQQELDLLDIPLAANEVGGRYGRTVYFNLASGTLTVRTVNQGEMVI